MWLSIVSITISLLTLSFSVFVYFRTRAKEKFNQDTNVLAVWTPGHLVSPELDVVNVEMITTNSSSLPFTILDARISIEFQNEGTHPFAIHPGNKVEGDAFYGSTLMSTVKHDNREIPQKSTALPIALKPFDAAHYTLVFSTPRVSNVTFNISSMKIIMHTSRNDVIEVTSCKLMTQRQTLEQYSKTRFRELM